SDLYRYYTYECVVTNVRAEAIASVPVDLPPGKVLVRDRRFIDEGYAKIDYLGTNQWLAADDPYIKAQLRNRPYFPLESEVLGAYPQSSVQQPHFEITKIVVWVMVLLPLSLVIGKGLLNQIRNNKERTT